MSEPVADPLLVELAALRGEIAELRQVVTQLTQALGAAGLPESQRLAHRTAERLNGEVLRRTAGGLEPADDTEVDLLIDRLHDLVDPSGP